MGREEDEVHNPRHIAVEIKSARVASTPGTDVGASGATQTPGNANPDATAAGHHGPTPYLTSLKMRSMSAFFGSAAEANLDASEDDGDYDDLARQNYASEARWSDSSGASERVTNGLASPVSAEVRERRSSAIELFSTGEGGAQKEDGGGGADLLGTMMGVFVPCLQNILGVILFIRLSWIVGQAGVGLSLVIVLMCCACTTLTGLSLSAVATNGIVKGGGPYFLISRTLGPEVGVSIGICFYLGTSVAASMYILGAVETLLDLAPGMRFASAGEPTVDANELRAYGAATLVLLVSIVLCGVKYIARAGPLFLVPVLVSVLFIYIGVLASGERSGLPEGAGISTQNLRDNWSFPSYVRTTSAGEPVVPAEGDDEAIGGVLWHFNALLALFFPSVTGIMAGSNRSAVLRDAQRSIPVGTLSAIGITTAVYVIAVVLYGASADRELLLGERLLSAKISWPDSTLVSVGITLSTIGAGLQSLMGAPRLLQAMAEDDLIPIFKYIKAKEGEDPTRCLALTAVVALGCVMAANLDIITPAITMFFLMCYAGVNMSCFLLGFLRTPNWRPRWKYHHWTISLLGAALCLVIMFMISYIFTFAALVAAGLVFWYVGSRQHGLNMGDGLKSVRFELALGSIKALGHEQMHPKNWYPSPLVLCKPWGLLADDVPCHPRLISFAKYLKNKGQGLLMVVSILEGDLSKRADEAFEKKERLSQHIQEAECDAFSDVIVAQSVREGFRSLIQSAGVGNLRPNLIVMRYPERWEKQEASMSDGGLFSPGANPVGRGETPAAKTLRSTDEGAGMGAGAGANGGQSPGLGGRNGSFTLSRRSSRRRRRSSSVGIAPIADQFVSIVNDCHHAGKGVVLIHNIDALPSSKFDKERTREIIQNQSTIDLYWLVRDGGLMLLLSGLLRRAAAFEGCRIRVFCMGEGSELGALKEDVQRFLYDLRMDATVTVLSVADADKCQHCNSPNHDIARRLETYKQSLLYVRESASSEQSGDDADRKRERRKGRVAQGVPSEAHVTHCLHASLKLNATVRLHSTGKAALVLLSMPPPPPDEPASNYMTYMDALLVGITTPTMVVRGYRRSVVSIYQ